MDNPFRVVLRYDCYYELDYDEDEIVKAIRAGIDPLELTIQQWLTIVGAYDAGITDHIRDRGINACALCLAYWENDCEGCPVKNATGRQHCVGTPYEDYQLGNDFISAAGQELEFLKGLRNGQDV